MMRQDIRSACPYCGVGCGIVFEVEGGRIVKLRGDPEHPANGGRLCTKGSSCDLPITSSARLDRAQIRRDRTAQPVATAIDDAINETARRLRAILDAHGPDAIALYVSGQMSMEAQYLANKLAKGYIRTQHIESNSRLCMAAAGAGYKLSLGADAPPGSYEDFDQTDLFFVIGANMADCHPILFLRLLDRKRAGAKLIVVDPRRTATAEKADLFLQIRPGTDLALLNGILHLLVAWSAIDAAFIAAHTTGWDEMPVFLADYTLDRCAAITGIEPDRIEQAARWIADAGDWMSLWTMGLNQSVTGAWNTNAICNLHLATGAICRPGSGPFSLTGQPNAMGGREMGYMGPGLPGQRSALVAEDRALAEQLWRLPPGTIRAEEGIGAIGMFDAMRRQDIRACWIICTNPVATVARRANVVEALQAADCVIVQDAYADSETGRHADILLPAALWAEADGVQVNSDRTMTLTRQAVASPGDALADWELIARVGRAMGFADGFSYVSAAEVFAEASQFANPRTDYDISGISHERLRLGPVQWPCGPGDSETRHPIRYLPGPSFPFPDGRARFLARPYLGAGEQPDDDFPLVLGTGRLQHQWHTLTKTGRVESLNKLNAGPFVELSPHDARRNKIKPDDLVEIRSRRGRAVLPVRITDRVGPGVCFAPFHWNDRFGDDLAVNALTPDAVDPVSLQPGFKLCAVAIARVAPPKEEAQLMPADAIPDRIAAHLGLAPHSTSYLSAPAANWLSGFLEGLRLSPPDGQLPVVPDHAPLTTAERLRVDGLLSGLYSRARSSLQIVDPAPEDDSGYDITVFWASQTGRAETAATEVAQGLKDAGRRVSIACLDTVSADRLPNGPVVFVTSTFGDGDPPDCAIAFWNGLHARNEPLDSTSHAVLALGDSTYGRFCGFGRALDEKLVELGSRVLVARQECEPDYEDAVADWRPRLLAALAPTTSSAVQAPPKAKTSRRDASVVAVLCRNDRLTSECSGRETRLIGFDLTSSGLRYEPGDALGIWPLNHAEAVDAALSAIGLPSKTPVTLKHHGIVSLRDALIRHFDLGRPAPAMLERLGTAEGYLPEMLANVRLSASPDEISQLFRKIQPRLYSIASSQRRHTAEVHLTVGVSHTPYRGLCSPWLADLALGAPANVFVQSNAHFRLPADGATPIIMIGPGTGIAPFRGFLQERAATQASGRAWLFFGERHAASTFYFEEELKSFLVAGTLTRLDTAFSRDQDARIYVQDRMEEHGAELWSWLTAGAHIYVCGDAARMARDVDAALRRLVARHGDMSTGMADAFVSDLTRAGRYRRDVY
ncbi:bifunctional nitrate reductase/sulfite reductase flavoprotein subunit alpha [Acetobacter nitrogenifigens]|uniref:bifunctional nitrate reductase/sulfite reductase flavoprotein subunit alpha n=2 Tax=Acetobacter nitrogenifigens TaxID=285268 RepID=UPI00040E5219|nr:bifunctional nitrate reductase/sulfite reductase flavoprotein subunit alpha [Acetobacter nitrogenifigens]